MARRSQLESAEVLDRLRAACTGAGGVAAWARRHGLSHQYVGDVLHGRRGIGDGVLRPLGLQRAEPIFVPREPETITLYDRDGLALLDAEVLP
jgi:hypothetical protein